MKVKVCNFNIKIYEYYKEKSACNNAVYMSILPKETIIEGDVIYTAHCLMCHEISSYMYKVPVERSMTLMNLAIVLYIFNSTQVQCDVFIRLI